MNARTKRLMPRQIPKYVRVYDNLGGHDRFTVVFTGRYRPRKTRGQFMHVGMSGDPCHPLGIYQHGHSDRQIDVNKDGFAPALGRKLSGGPHSLHLLAHGLPGPGAAGLYGDLGAGMKATKSQK